MKKTILSLVASITICAMVTAQSVNDGVKFLYYERVTSAKQTLQKVVAGNPKDPLAIYWLGIAYMFEGSLDSAKTVYQNALNNGVNDPFIWVGTAHVEVMKGGDINAAKQRFEQAITSSTSTKGKNKGPNPDILTAVGRAMATGGSDKGDPNYGLDKLKQAASIDPKNPEIFINMGLCYLKLGGDHGGQAFEAFRQATQVDPQYARAYYRIGKVYQTQRNKESMDEWYGKAIAADATFAPVYLQYFLYFSEKDVNVAKEYLDKYVQYADKDCNTDYFVGDYLFRAGKYQESLQKAKEMESGACKDFPRVNMLYAYDYDRLGDSVQARSYVQKFYSSVDTSLIQPSDYAFAGNVLAKFPETSNESVNYFMTAIAKDTVKENQKDYLNSAVTVASRTKNYAMLTQLINSMPTITGSKLSETQYFNIAKAITDAAQADSTGTFDSTKYLAGYSLIQSYITAYPERPQPYSFLVRYAKYTDRDTSRGLALEPIRLQNEFSKKDTAVTAKQTAFRNDTYVMIYYANYAPGDKAENYKKAIAMADEMIALYPDPASEENKYAAGIKATLEKALKPKSGGTKQQ